MKPRELRAKAAELFKKARELNEKAEEEDRAFSTEEQTQFNQWKIEAEDLVKRAEIQEAIPDNLLNAPPVLNIKRGDNFDTAMSHYLKTGDGGGIRSLQVGEERGKAEYEIAVPSAYDTHPLVSEKRATDEIINLTDAAPAVPTGLVNRIIGRRNEIDLSVRLGCQRVTGQGTTVNYPYENADPSVFAATLEQIDDYSKTFQRDRPTIATKAFTLAKKTKKIVLTDETLEDEDAALMNFIGDHIGRAIGLTKNALLLTEAAATGTPLKVFASATAIAAGEIEPLIYHDTLGYYLDDTGAIGWIMKPSTFGKIKAITGDSRLYAPQVMGSRGNLEEYPVYFSASAGAMTASGKSVYLGNWWYMGVREGNSIGFLRDPYTTDGVVYLKYWFRIVFGQLIAGAIGYGKQATA